MKRKLLTLLMVMTLLITSSLGFAEVLTPSKVSIGLTPDGINTMVLKMDNSVFVSGLIGKDSYLAKFDDSLKSIWKLKLSATPTTADYYGGYIYALSSTSLYKIDANGKLIWEKKFPISKSGINPNDMIIAGNQVFFTLQVPNGSKFNIMTGLIDLEGQSLVTKQFSIGTYYFSNVSYEQGQFYFDQGEQNYASTADNITFKSGADRLKVLSQVFSKRMDGTWKQISKDGVAAPEGSTYYYSFNDVADDDIFVMGSLGEPVTLEDGSLFGPIFDLNYFVTGYGRTEKSKSIIVATPSVMALAPNVKDYAGITSNESFTEAFNQYLEGYSASDYDKIMTGETLALFAERGAAKANAITVASGDTVTAESFGLDIFHVRSLISEVDLKLLSNGFSGFRTPKAYNMVSLSDATGSLVLSSDLAGLDASGLIIETPKAQIIIDQKALKDLKTTGDLTITLNSEMTKVSVSFDKPLASPVTIALPKVSGNTDTQTIFGEGDKNIGGKYNPATGMLEAKIKTSGTFTAKQNVKSFSDMAYQTADIKQAVQALAAKGIMGGKSESSFAPDALISRIEIAALMLNMTALLEDKGVQEFSDVKPTDWFFNIAYSAKKNGIMSGSGANFQPKNLINKEQLLTILSGRLVSDSGYKVSTDFNQFAKNDIKDTNLVSSWAKDHFALAMQDGFLINYRAAYLDPKVNLTRGEAAKLIYEFYKRWW